MKTFLIFILSFTTLLAFEKNDFAYKKNISLSQESGVIRLNLDNEIYKDLVYSDMSDLAVFDANGNMMPREISNSHNKQKMSEKIKVPFVKFEVLKNSSDAQLRFEYKGALVEMNSLKQSKNEDYIVDLRNVKRAVKNLYIHSDEKKYMISMNVECSKDLKQWKLIKENAVLASMDFQDSSLKKDSVNLSYSTCRFLCLKSTKKFSISKVEVEEYPLNIQVNLENAKIDYKKNKNGLEFTVSKNIRVENIIFNLKNKEQLYKLKILAKNSINKEWMVVSVSDIYTIIENNIKLEEHKVYLNTRYKYYRIKAQESSYLPSNISLSYEYKKQDLFFIAQGDAPYILAFGSFEATVKSISLGQSDRESIIESKLGETVVLGGKDKLLAKKKEISYSKYWIWFGLVFGVFILAFMSFTLYKQMKEKK